MKKVFLVILFIFLTTIATFSYAADVSTTSGFIPGQIWYSEDSLIEGNTVNIHTAVWNREESSLSVNVEFYDKNVILGSRDIVLAPSELKDVSVPWKITSGDHVISAKIISSLVTTSGKKEKVVLNRTTTANDKQSVSAVVRNNLGEVVSGTDAFTTGINKVGDEISNIVPSSVSKSVSNNFTSIEKVRNDASTKINNAKDETQKEIDSIKKLDETPKTLNEKSNIEDAVKKPIAYIKLFLLTFLAFIFSNKIVFYGVIVLIIFYIIRFIYYKIKNR